MFPNCWQNKYNNDIYIYIQLQHIPPMYIFVLNIFWQQLYAVFACQFIL